MFEGFVAAVDRVGTGVGMGGFQLIKEASLRPHYPGS